MAPLPVPEYSCITPQHAGVASGGRLARRSAAVAAAAALGALLLCGWLASGVRPRPAATRVGTGGREVQAERLFDDLRLLKDRNASNGSNGTLNNTRGAVENDKTFSCSEYTCVGKAVCNIAANANVTVTKKDAQRKCCEKQECCKAPIAECLSCETCQSVTEFCTPLLEKWFPKPTTPEPTTTPKPTLKELVKSRVKARVEKWQAKKETSRRLAELGSTQGDGEAAPPPPPLAPSAEAMAAKEEDEREVAAEVARQLSNATGGAGKTVGLSMDKAAFNEHVKLLKGMLDANSAAYAFAQEEQKKRLAAAKKAAPQLPTSPGGWGKAWHEAVAKFKTGGVVPGCVAVSVGSCPYYLQSVFLLHRGTSKGEVAVNTVQVLADTRHAVSCGDDARCWVWKIRSATPREVFVLHKGPVYTASVMAEPGLIFSGGAAFPWGGRGSMLGSGFFWRWRDGMPESKFTSPTGVILASASIPATSKIILGAGKKNGYIASWRSHFAEDVLHTLGPVNAASYVPTKRRFVTGHETGIVAYWNARTAQLIRVIHAHKGPVNAIAGHPSRQWAFSGGEDGTVRLWDLEDGTPKRVFDQAYAGPVRSVAVVPGGTVVAVGANDGVVRLWQRDTGILSCAINTGGGQVLGLAVNPSNPLGQILAANADGYVRVFSPR